MMLYKYDSSGQTRRFLKIAFWKSNCWHHDLLMQPIRTIWTIFKGAIPFKFCQIPISGSIPGVVWTFPYIIQCKIVTPGRGQFWPQGQILNNLGRGPFRWCYIPNIKALGLVVSKQNDFWILHFENLFLTSWPTK